RVPVLGPDHGSIINVRGGSRMRLSFRMISVRPVTLGAGLMFLALGSEITLSATRHANGAFEVKTTPVVGVDQSVASARLTLSKTFTGDLIGASKVEMWTVQTPAKGSAGYVAIERFEGTLQGRKGTFALIHQGTMESGANADLRIVVVPGSATGELEGLGGTMTIRIEKGGAHFYDLHFTLPSRE